MQATIWTKKDAWRFFFHRLAVDVNNRAIVAMYLARAEDEARARGWWISYREDHEQGRVGRVRVTLNSAEEPFETLATVGDVENTEEATREADAWLCIEALLYEKIAAVRS